MTLARRALGQTDIEVSCLGLGTVKFGRNQEVKYPASFKIPSDQEITTLLSKAKELGINLLDTAPAYGNSEQRLGRLLSNRQDWVLCTKVGEEFINGKSVYDFSGDHVRRSIERSLRAIKTDFLDIVLVHSDGRDMDIIDSTDCLPTLLELKEKGLIRAVGMSTKTIAGGLRASELTDVVMVTYNPSATGDAEVIEHAHSLNKGVLIKKVLNSGQFTSDNHAAAIEENFRFVFSAAGVTSVVVGTINPEHLEENVAAAAGILA